MGNAIGTTSFRDIIRKCMHIYIYISIWASSGQGYKHPALLACTCQINDL